MKTTILSFWLVLAGIATMAQVKTIKTTDAAKKDYYAWITFLTEGENYAPASGNQEFAMRFVVTTAEIYDQIYLEKASMGTEGGGKKIVSKRQVDMQAIANAFGLEGEMSGIKFEKWHSWNSFEIILLETRLLFSNIDQKEIRISKI